MQFEKYHVHEIRPENIARINDEALLAFIQFHRDMKEVCGRRFANWLQEILCREYERRNSGGAMELCSWRMPELTIPELQKCRSWATIQTYSECSSAPFWDEVLWQLELQTAFFLKKCEIMMERENEQKQFQGQ